MTKDTDDGYFFKKRYKKITALLEVGRLSFFIVVTIYKLNQGNNEGCKEQ